MRRSAHGTLTKFLRLKQISQDASSSMRYSKSRYNIIETTRGNKISRAKDHTVEARVERTVQIAASRTVSFRSTNSSSFFSFFIWFPVSPLHSLFPGAGAILSKMKAPIALSTLLSSCLAATIPSHVHSHPYKRTALPEPVCTFDALSLLSFPVPHLERRDLNQTTWNPPSNLVAPLKEVWDHEISTYSDALGFKNYGFDQVVAGKGKCLPQQLVGWSTK